MQFCLRLRRVTLLQQNKMKLPRRDLCSKTIFNRGRGGGGSGGPMVSVLASYSNVPSSNPAESTTVLIL